MVHHINNSAHEIVHVLYRKPYNIDNIGLCNNGKAIYQYCVTKFYLDNNIYINK